MRSKWFKLKPQAIKLRQEGKSLREIEKELSIPRSTLSGWLRSIPLEKEHLTELKRRHLNALERARKASIIWHNQQKINRIKLAEGEADELLSNINFDQEIIELSMALLYLGEGAKKSPTTSIGNTDPLILKFFLDVMINIYKVKIDQIRFDLHLRADQDIEEIRNYWSQKLNVPTTKFKYVTIDKRTLGRPSYPNYKGV